MHIVPAIDIIEGKCVRLSQGEYDRMTVYHTDPLEVAKKFEGAGMTRLHLVDLDGAKAKHVINWRTLERIARSTKLHIDFGGGVKSDEDLRVVFECGAQQVTAGSIAAKHPEVFHRWLEVHGSERIILGADLKEGKIATHGWKESTDQGWKEFLAIHLQKGACTVICTDVAQDGMLQGPATGLYKEMMEQYDDMQLIASGGVSSIEDLEELREIGCYGAIVGKAIYENKISLKDLEKVQHAR